MVQRFYDQYRVRDGAATLDRLTPQQLAGYIEFQSNREKIQQMTEKFDLQALQIVASRVMKCQCNGIYLIAEGGFNQVFVLTFVDGVDVIARLNSSSAKQDETFPEHMRTSRFVSEVATLAFLRQNTTIPVPEVYSYDSDPRNSIGAMYILQERMPGGCLGSNQTFLWAHLTYEQRKIVVTQIADYEAQLLRHWLPSIGRIFLTPSPGDPDRCHSPRRHALDDSGYFIGSLGFPILNEDMMDLRDIGPWTNSTAYVLALIKNQIEYMEKHSQECIAQRKSSLAINHEEDDPFIMEYLQSAYRLLLKCTTACLNDPTLAVLSDPTSQHFILHHPDISAPNIMVSYGDTTRVTGIIDWEGAAVVPIWSEPTGRRLLDVDHPDGRELSLQRMRRQILDEQVPDSKRIRLLANEFCLNRLTRIMLYNAVAWMSKSSLNSMFMTWLNAFTTSRYHQYYNEFREFIQVHADIAQNAS